MASIAFKGLHANTLGSLPELGQKAPDFELTGRDLSTVRLSDFKGKKVILNIFPSVDTGTCAQSVRQFNIEAAELKDTQVLCISRDLPFAQSRFCGAEGIDKVLMLSDYKTGAFGKDYELIFTDGPFEGLHSRAVLVLDKDGKVIHNEQVVNIGEEPNYKAALEALTNG
ncbi:thiol peroxidase [Robiginitalea sp. IMCC43444]|uniref:thiol peroxidase n=1 Tax=Robiginitalea sp. IMCC43444 TaxID=3459121 RepID=UPI0040424B8A